MASMPTIDDRMVVELRRTGRRRASYTRAGSNRRNRNSSRVLLQRHNPCAGKHSVPCGGACPFPGMWCCNNQPSFDPC
jgi:hypothetical protein